MQTNQITEFVKRHSLGLLIAGFLVILLFIASRFSFITISVQSPGTSGDYTYRITDASGKTTSSTGNKPSFRKLVGKGTYSVEASQNDKNYFAIVSMPGFFINKKVSATLASEKARSFVGDNPETCMRYSTTVLLSYACAGTMKSLKAHMPAVGSQATLARTVEASGDEIEGMARVGDKTIALIKTVGGDSSSTSRLITTINQDGAVVDEGSFHQELSSSKPYQLEQFQDGFVVSGGDSASELYYYKTPKQQGEKISLTPPKDKKLTAYAWGTSNDSVAIAYTNPDKSEALDAHAETTGGTSTVLLLQDKKSKEIKMKGYFADIKPCGTKKLCVINGKELRVYDVSGKPKLKFSLPAVQAIENTNNVLLVVTDNNVLALDVDTLTGSIDYNLGTYAFCGVSADSQGYQLCLINEQQRKVAVRFDRSKDNTNSIDKKIVQLQKSKAVSLVSVYGNTIVVVPNYGAKVYDPAQKIYTNDPSTVTRMNAQFTKDLQESGINVNEFTVTGLQQK